MYYLFEYKNSKVVGLNVNIFNLNDHSGISIEIC